MHVIAAKAVALKEAMGEDFKEYQRQIVRNARCLANELADRGYDIVSKGTDNHLFLMDLRKTALTGQEAEAALDRAGISVNKNAVPYDPRGVQVTSGIRLGTPAVTTRSMKEPEMLRIAEWIDRVLRAPADDSVLKRVREEVRELCQAFPVYPRRASPIPVCGAVRGGSGT